MNKFFSFEMIFENGNKFTGNIVYPWKKDITTGRDIKEIEYRIKNKINDDCPNDELRVHAITLINWKTL